MTSKPGAREFRMELSDRRTAVEETGDVADARRIQSVLFGHGFIGDFDLGVDLQSYVFEFSDTETTTDIESKISTQLAKYCPRVMIREVVVTLLDSSQDPHGKPNSKLLVAVSIGSGSKPIDVGFLLDTNAGKTVIRALDI